MPAKSDKTKWERKRQKTSQLHPHPDQIALYEGTTSSAEDETFAKDLDDRGQLDDIHVMPARNAAGLPKNTVLDGWRRKTMLQAKGNREVDVIIRHDLADATYAEVQSEFVRFNFGRRQLSPLARAKCAKFLMTAETAGSGGLGKARMEELMNRIAALLHVGIRTVNRLLAILEAPLAIQQAYDRGEISQVDAAKFGTMCSKHYGTLTKRQQEELASRLAAGEPAAKLVREYIEAYAEPMASTNSKERAEGCLLRLRDLIRDLDKEGRTLDSPTIKSREKILRKGKEVIERLLARL